MNFYSFWEWIIQILNFGINIYNHKFVHSIEAVHKFTFDFFFPGFQTSNEYVNNYLFRKSYPPTDVYSNKPTTGKKKVSFGSVSEKLIPSREEAIESGELAATSERISVFDRLGFNRTF